MKRCFVVAAIAAMFVNANVNASNETFNRDYTIAEVVSELNFEEANRFVSLYQKMINDITKVNRLDISAEKKNLKIENIKENYATLFSEVLVTEQNEVAINTIPFDYINNRMTK